MDTSSSTLMTTNTDQLISSTINDISTTDIFTITNIIDTTASTDTTETSTNSDMIDTEFQSSHSIDVDTEMNIQMTSHSPTSFSSIIITESYSDSFVTDDLSTSSYITREIQTNAIFTYDAGNKDTKKKSILCSVEI